MAPNWFLWAELSAGFLGLAVLSLSPWETMRIRAVATALFLLAVTVLGSWAIWARFGEARFLATGLVFAALAMIDVLVLAWASGPLKKFGRWPGKFLLWLGNLEKNALGTFFGKSSKLYRSRRFVFWIVCGVCAALAHS